MADKEQHITQDEFKSFKKYLDLKINMLEQTLHSYMIRCLESEYATFRLSRYLIDEKKLFSPKELVDFGNKNEFLELFIQEREAIVELLDTLQKYPSDFEKIRQKDAEMSTRMADIKIKKCKLTLERAKETKEHYEAIKESMEDEIKRLESFKKQQFEVIDVTKDYKELRVITDKTKAEEITENFFKINKKDFVERMQKMPTYPGGIHLEPSISNLYADVYHLCWLGRDTAAIVMMGVFLEAFLKEIIFFKDGKEFFDIIGEEQADFFNAIKYCKDKAYVTDRETTFLHNFRIEIRKKYVHHTPKKIVGKASMLVGKIEFKDGENPLEALIKGKKEFEEGKNREWVSTDELRPLGDILSREIDRGRAVPLLYKVTEFMIKKAKQYFSTEEKKKDESKKEPEKKGQEKSETTQKEKHSDKG